MHALWQHSAKLAKITGAFYAQLATIATASASIANYCPSVGLEHAQTQRGAVNQPRDVMQ